MKKADPFYLSPAWRTLRREAIGAKVQGGCAKCGHPFTRLKGITVDHIIPRLEAPHLALSLQNLRLMHHHCHSTHTRLAENDNNQPVDTDGFPATWR